MIAEALEKLQKLIEDGAAVKQRAAVIDLPNEPGGRYGIIKPDHSFEIRDPSLPERSHKLLSVKDISQYLEDGQGDGWAPAPTVWYSPDGVDVVLNDDRESRETGHSGLVRVDLRETDELAAVRKLFDLQEMTARQMLKYLRAKLWSSLDDNGVQFTKLLRHVSFNTHRSGHERNEIGHTGYGADIEAEIRSEMGDLSQYESMTLHVRMFDDPALADRYEIKVVLDCDPNQRTFALVPLAGEIDHAMENAMWSLGDYLGDMCKCPVYYGVP